MDEQDYYLIDLLKIDGRQTAKSLAKSMGISRASVGERITRLRQEGVIKIKTYIDPRALSSPFGVLAYINIERDRLGTTIDNLVAFPNVVGVNQLTGRFNILVTMMFSDYNLLSEMIVKELTKLPGIESLDICFVLHLPWLSPVQSAYSIDTLDKKIIGLLEQDGRASSRLIAQQLNVNASTVQRRINRLVDSGIMRVVPVINQKSVDNYCLASVGLKVQHPKMPLVIDKLSNHPELTLAFTTGIYNMIVRFTKESRSAVIDFVQNEIDILEGVANMDLFIVEDYFLGPMSYAGVMA